MGHPADEDVGRYLGPHSGPYGSRRPLRPSGTPAPCSLHQFAHNRVLKVPVPLFTRRHHLPRALQARPRAITTPVLLMHGSPRPRNRCAYVGTLEDRQVRP